MTKFHYSTEQKQRERPDCVAGKTPFLRFERVFNPGLYRFARMIGYLEDKFFFNAKVLLGSA
jgi:hypothetical protein